MEVHFGDMPDISMFRFKFWQSVEIYNQQSSFPNSKLIPARLLGIAWEHGDVSHFEYGPSLKRVGGRREQS